MFLPRILYSGSDGISFMPERESNMDKKYFWKNLNCLWVFVFCIAVLWQAALSAPAVSAQALIVNAAEAEALEALNADRAKAGLKPLVYNESLTRLAREYAADMMERRFFAHDNPEGLTPFDRMRIKGISYRYAGENLAINDTVRAAQAAFMNSPTHRENVLHSQYSEVGIGVLAAPNGKIYVVQEFIGY